MSVDLATLSIRVDASQGIRELDKYETATNRTIKASDVLESHLKVLEAAARASGTSMAHTAEQHNVAARAADKAAGSQNQLADVFNKLTSAAAAYQAIGLIRDAIDLGDAYSGLHAQLGLVTTDTQNLNHVQAELFRVSQDTRSALDSNVALYASLSRSTQALGLDQSQLLTITQAVGQSFLVSGASAGETNAAVRQLSQALASGVLRGDEFNSMAENAPRLQRAVADALHVTNGELRNMAAEGKITSEVLTHALLDSADAIKREAAGIPTTVGGALTQVHNSVLVFIGAFDQAAGATGSLAKSLTSFAELLGSATAKATAFGESVRMFGFAFSRAAEGFDHLGEIITGVRHAMEGYTSFSRTEFQHGIDEASAAIDAYRGNVHLLQLGIEGLKGPSKEAFAFINQLTPQGPTSVRTGGTGLLANPFPSTQPSAQPSGPPTTEITEAERAYQKLMETAELARDRQLALNAAFNQGRSAIDDINGAFDLKNKLAAIDATYTGHQAETLRGLARDLDTATTAARRLAEAEAKALEGEARWVQVREAQTAAARASGEVSEMLQHLSDSMAAGSASNAEQLEAQRQEIALLKARGDEVRKLSDAYLYAAKFKEFLENSKGTGTVGDPVGARKAAEEFVRNVHLIDDLRHKTQDWSDVLQSVVGITQLLAAGFGDVGRTIAQAATGAQSLLAGLKQNQALQAQRAAGNAVSGVDQLASYGAIAGGIVQLGNALLSLDHSQERAQQHADALAQAFDKQVQSMQRLTEASTDSFAAINASTEALEAQARAVLKAEINAAGGDEAKARAAFQQMGAALETITGLENDRTKALQAQIIALRQANEDLQVRMLRATGQDGTADLVAFDRQQQRDAAAAHDKYKDAAYDAALATTQLAERTKFLADQQRAATAAAEEDARQKASELQRMTRSVFDTGNSTQAFTDPRGASDAAFWETQRRRYEDAGTDVEKLAAKAFNAAEALDHFTQLALKDAADSRGFLARIATGSGDTRFGEDITRLSSQLTERQQGAGMTPANQLLMDRAQFVENSAVIMQRAIEDGTKALQDRAKSDLADVDVLMNTARTFAAQELAVLDEKIKKERDSALQVARAYDEQLATVRDAVKAQQAAFDVQAQGAQQAQQLARSMVGGFEQATQDTTKLLTTLATAADSLKLGDLSTLSPVQKLAEARAQLDALTGRAFGGDKEAAGGVGGAIAALLQASRTVNASGAGYTSDATRAQDVLAQLTAKFGAQLTSEQQSLNLAQRAADLADAQLTAIQQQRDAFAASSDAQIAAIQAAKEAASAHSAELLTQWQQDQADINTNLQASLERMDTLKAAISTALDANTATLAANEQAAHAERLAFSDWRERLYKEQTDATLYLSQLVEQYSGISTAFGPVGGDVASEQQPPKFITPTRDVDSGAALKEQNVTLRLQVEELQAQTVELKAQTVELKAAVKLGIEAAREAKVSALKIVETIQDTSRSTKSAVENAVYNVRR